MNVYTNPNYFEDYSICQTDIENVTFSESGSMALLSIYLYGGSVITIPISEIDSISYSLGCEEELHSCGASNVHNAAKSYGTLTDQEGNVYKTIVVGFEGFYYKEWMAENLKTSIYRNGDPIAQVTDNAQWSSLASGAWCAYNNDPTLECPYGKLYNFYAVADPRNVCPTGWHVPTDGEWNELIAYLHPSYNPDVVNGGGGGGVQSTIAGGKLKSSGLAYWNTPNDAASNEIGFSGLPGGDRWNDGTFYDMGGYGLWWTSTESSSFSAFRRYIGYNNGDVIRNLTNKLRGASVRCIRDTYQGSINGIDCGSSINIGTLISGFPAIGVSSNITYTGGNGSGHNGQTVASTGVSGLTATLGAGAFANGSGELTYTITGTPGSAGTASFALNIGGQTCTLQLSVGVPIISSAHTCGVPNVHNTSLITNTMTDQDGNVYKTIAIGNREWMAENLKTNTYRNGDPITHVTDNAQWSSLTTGARSSYSNDPGLECPYGKLYNWYAVADPRNVCPTGWHVPTDGEWNELIGYLDPSYDPNAMFPADQSTIAGGKLKSSGVDYWINPNTDATNESGFSGLPGGFRGSNGMFFSMGTPLVNPAPLGRWWSSTEDSVSGAWARQLNYDNGNISRNLYNVRFGMSVRCIRD